MGRLTKAYVWYADKAFETLSVTFVHFTWTERSPTRRTRAGDSQTPGKRHTAPASCKWLSVVHGVHG